MYVCIFSPRGALLPLQVTGRFGQLAALLEVVNLEAASDLLVIGLAFFFGVLRAVRMLALWWPSHWLDRCSANALFFVLLAGYHGLWLVCIVFSDREWREEMQPFRPGSRSGHWRGRVRLRSSLLPFSKRQWSRLEEGVDRR